MVRHMWTIKFLLPGAVVALSLALSQSNSAGANQTRPIIESADEPTSEDRKLDAVWVMDPTLPGDDLPTRGRSLFDRLFIVRKNEREHYELPFPFSKLIDRIEAVLSDGARVKQVLIPLGRSLQRHTAAPDFFKYPRLIAAVDTESADPGIMLKDRLFLGYQEKGQVIEVISYNEQLARFEFQVVHHYDSGLQPQVFYARRQICISCHQNSGPIFSRSAWSETAANPAIARRLLEQRNYFYRVAVQRSAIDAFAVDAATDRANLFSVWKLLWRDGCGDNDRAARMCRGAVFIAALQSRLAAGEFDRNSAAYTNEFEQALGRNWLVKWPGGLKIPDADLPNRDPVTEISGIVPNADPLIPRQPLEIWRTGDPTNSNKLITGIAESISTSLIGRLDEVMRERGRSIQPRKLESSCATSSDQFSDVDFRVSFVCYHAPGSPGFDMKGRLYVQDDQITDGAVDELRLESGTKIENLKVADGNLSEFQGGVHAEFSLWQKRTGLQARIADGSSVSRIIMNWPAAAGRSSLTVSSITKARASLLVVDDFTLVGEKIRKLAIMGDVFSSVSLQASQVVSRLINAISGDSTGTPCCENTLPIAAAHDSVVPLTFNASPSTLAGGQEVFGRLCGTCHGTQSPFPPNFLYGSAKQVASRMAHCAHRIWYRLQLWQLPDGERLMSPMPPVAALLAAGFTEQEWVRSPEYRLSRTHIESILSARAMRSTSLHGRDYDELRECLPE